MVEIHVRPGTE